MLLDWFYFEAWQSVGLEIVFTKVQEGAVAPDRAVAQVEQEMRHMNTLVVYSQLSHMDEQRIN